MTNNVKQRISCLILLLGVVLGCVSGLLIIRFGLGPASARIFPDSIYALEKVTNQFIKSLQAGETEQAYQLLDDTSTGSQAVKDAITLMNEEAVIRYEELYLCDAYSKKDVSESFGILYYQETSVRFKVELVKSDDRSWKIHSFVLQPEYGPGEFGGCQ